MAHRLNGKRIRSGTIRIRRSMMEMARPAIASGQIHRLRAGSGRETRATVIKAAISSMVG